MEIRLDDACAPLSIERASSHRHERFTIEVLVLTNLLDVAAATWGVILAPASLLQLRRMLRRRSSDDVSIDYLVLLLPSFCLWVSYGIASRDTALAIPDTVAAVIAGLTIAVAVRLRTGCSRRRPTKPPS